MKMATPDSRQRPLFKKIDFIATGKGSDPRKFKEMYLKAAKGRCCREKEEPKPQGKRGDGRLDATA